MYVEKEEKKEEEEKLVKAKDGRSLNFWNERNKSSMCFHGNLKIPHLEVKEDEIFPRS
jgi:hypothetical protein